MCLTILETIALKGKQISTLAWKIIKVIFLILASDLPLIFLKVFIVRQFEFVIQQLVAILTFFIILKRLRAIVIFSLSKNFVANFFNMLFIQKMFIKKSHFGP